MRFYFPEVDVELSAGEFFGAVALGIAICTTPFIVKAILLAVHFGGV